MYVRISPEDGSLFDFEVDIDFLSPEVERAVQEVIFKETG